MTDTIQFYTESASCSGTHDSNTNTPINKCAPFVSGAFSVKVSEFPSCNSGTSPRLQVYDANDCQGEPWTTITAVGNCLSTDGGQGHVATAGMFVCVDSNGAIVTAATSSSPLTMASSSALSTASSISSTSTSSPSTLSSDSSEGSKTGSQSTQTLTPSMPVGSISSSQASSTISSSKSQNTSTSTNSGGSPHGLSDPSTGAIIGIVLGISTLLVTCWGIYWAVFIWHHPRPA